MNTVNITGSTVGQVNVETAFNQSTNLVRMCEPGPIKDALAQLLEQTKRLAARLPEEQREEVAKNTETVASDSVSTLAYHEAAGRLRASLAMTSQC